MASPGCFCWPRRSTRRVKIVDDSDWVDVVGINYYAVFMGYLSMAIKGLCFLVITWTTVVLLGGFVSDLGKKDFWSLTAITLVQTAGIFDVVMNEKLSHMTNAYRGLFFSTLVTTVKERSDSSQKKEIKEQSASWSSHSHIALHRLAYRLLALVKFALQALVFIIVLCPLGVLYIFGLPISAGISLWRLIKHDYGNTDEAANMKKALDVLYSLVVIQGALFCYRASYAISAKSLVKLLAKKLKLEGRDEDLVSDYLRETRTGCEKDPSFSRGRNLITYAVNQMESVSPDNYISGVKILGTIIKAQKARGMHLSNKPICKRLIKEVRLMLRHLLLRSASSGHMLDNILLTLDSRSLYDIETKEFAATVVEHIAGGIRLKLFPGGIQCIASLLDTQGLEVQGLRILGELAVACEENCKIISNTQGLLSRIMSPVTMDLVHNRDHDSWNDIVREPLIVMERLMAAAGETGNMVRQQIAINKEVISSMESILKCDYCDWFHQQRAMGILAQLFIDTSVSMDTEWRKNYITTLLLIFVSVKKDSRARKVAGEKLATIASINGSNAMVILNANDEVLDNLIAILLEFHGKSECTISASEILEQLCIAYIKNNENLDKLKKLKTDVLPKVLREILFCLQTEEHTRTGAENDSFDIEGQDVAFSPIDDRDKKKSIGQKVKKLIKELVSGNGRFGKQGTDIERQDYAVRQNYDRYKIKLIGRKVIKLIGKKVRKWTIALLFLNSSDQDTTLAPKQDRQEQERKLLAALLSLSVSIFDKLICNDNDVALLVEAVPLGDKNDWSSLPKKLMEMVERNSQQTTDCLKIMKLIGMMAISMMKHTNLSSIWMTDLLDKLYSASENMKPLEVSMIFERGDDGTKPYFRTLGSLVKEARDRRYAQGSVYVDHIE